jgi:hypothetical protein
VRAIQGRSSRFLLNNRGFPLNEHAQAQLSVAAIFDGPLSKDFDGLPTSASRAL